VISVRARQALRTGHKWIAIAVAPLLLLQVITGLMLTFKDELAWRLDASMRSIVTLSRAAPQARISPDHALERALRALPPDCAPERLYFPKHDRSVFLLKCTRHPGGDELLATVDPWTGSVVDAGAPWRFPFELADELHLDWRIETPGRLIIGTVGCILLTLAATGFIVWWPGLVRVVRALNPAWRGSTRARLRIFHRLIGPVATVFIVLAISAGIVAAWRPWIEPLVGRVLPLASAPKVEPPASRAAELISLAEVERLALTALPGATVRDVRSDDGGFEVVRLIMNPAEEARPRAADHVWFDRRTGDLLAVAETANEPAGTRLLGWVLPVHTGQALGLAGRILMVCIGLAALALLVSGVWSAFARPAPVRK
jgi:uncharacterized iron-regulated membrane protein